MKNVPRVATAMMEVLTARADEAARVHQFVVRRSKLSGATFTQALIFGALTDPQATLDVYARTAGLLGVPATGQAFDERFSPRAAAMLRDVLESAAATALAADPLVVPLLDRFPAVYVRDSTRIALPDALASVWRGTGGSGPAAALKLQVRLDLRGGTLHGPYLQPAHENDQGFVWPNRRLADGALLLGDLGYWSVAAFAREGACGRFWLSRLHASVSVCDEAGRPLDVAEHLAPCRHGAAETAVVLTKTHALRCRLVGERVAEEVAAERRRRMRIEARKHGETPTAKRLAMAEWNVYVTNVGAQHLTAGEVLTIGRTRWQIEILFKLWKSKGRIDESRSGKPWRVLCEVYAKLIAVLIDHWILLIDFWRQPYRSLFKAVDLIRGHASALAASITSKRRLCDTLRRIRHALQSGCRTQKRRSHPGTFCRLMAAQQP